MPEGPADAPVELKEDEEALTVALFLAMGTQWRTAGMAGVRVGLDYSQIDATAQLCGVEMSPARFGQLREMEIEALTSWSEQRARDT